eukprot:262597-Hanusia_phi.AAC.2
MESDRTFRDGSRFNGHTAGDRAPPPRVRGLSDPAGRVPPRPGRRGPGPGGRGGPVTVGRESDSGGSLSRRGMQ